MIQHHQENPRLREFAGLLNQQIDRLQPQAPTLARDFFETFAEYLPCVIWTAAPDGTMLYLNRRFRELTGYDGLEPYSTCFHPDDATRCEERWRKSMLTLRPHHNHARVRDANGEYVWMVSSATPFFGADGDVAFWIGSATVLPEPTRQALRAA